jgi:predicted 2-oxoglutarate/Fe(II)-dependent dioxygenase YbiX
LQVSSALGALRMEQVGEKPAVSLSRTTYITDWHFRVVKAYHDVAVEGHAAQVLADTKKHLFFDEPIKIQRHAPVLLIPNVLSTDVCTELIDLWERGGNEDSGFMKQIDGKTVGMTDYSHKIRRDHFMGRGPLEEKVKRAMAHRVTPMMLQAFNYNATRREDFRIACYDASRGGYFRPHRDNTTSGTAHRRFAMSLLLNDDYENGWLRFPEYGPHLYRPIAGSAVIFSCSLLHEATDVTAGRRFVLLSFFYGEAEAKAREEHERRTGGAYRA